MSGSLRRPTGLKSGKLARIYPHESPKAQYLKFRISESVNVCFQFGSPSRCWTENRIRKKLKGKKLKGKKDKGKRLIGSPRETATDKVVPAAWGGAEAVRMYPWVTPKSGTLHARGLGCLFEANRRLKSPKKLFIKSSFIFVVLWFY